MNALSTIKNFVFSFRVNICDSLVYLANSLLASLQDGLYSLWLLPQSGHRTDRVGRHGPEPHHEHERPWLRGKVLSGAAVLEIQEV